MKNASKNASPLKLSETKELAQKMLEQVRARAQARADGLASERTGALVIGLYGDLGAGKTTFMQFFGESLGVKEKILSPTFVIEKIYKIDQPDFDHLVHIDAYRLDSPSEMLNLGWSEIVKNPRNIICVEWADKIADLLPADTVSINFSHHDEESRVIEIE